MPSSTPASAVDATRTSSPPRSGRSEASGAMPPPQMGKEEALRQFSVDLTEHAYYYQQAEHGLAVRTALLALVTGGIDTPRHERQKPDVEHQAARFEPLEPGSGRETFARYLHAQSARRDRPFIDMGVSSIAKGNSARELFGSEDSGRIQYGALENASGGTLFLDEVGDLPLSLQAKLLRFLQEGQFERVGGEKTLTVSVKVISATNKDLNKEVETGGFRKDLFYALSVVHVKLPPLRERPGDIEDLARFFMDSLAGGLGLAPMPLDPERILQLQEHDWPGNARELRSFIERVLMLGEFPSEPLQSSGHISGSGPFGYPEDWPLERVKTDHMKRVLAACDDNRSRAARRLGVSRKTLERKLGPRRE